MVTSQQRNRKAYLYVSFLVLIMTSNILIYHSPLHTIIPEDVTWVVFGSLLDLTIFAPLLILLLTRKKGFTFKRIITWIVIGALLARLLIPTAYFEPFRHVPLFALGIEAKVLLTELWLLLLFIYHLPKIFNYVKEQEVSPIFSFPQAIETRVRSLPLIKVISAELLMFYYAFTMWKKPVPEGPNYFSLHKNTSVTAFYIMLIHAIIIETIGIHWWLHSKSLIVAIILLVLNVYSVIYLIGDLQAMRYNPTYVTDDKIYLSQGLGKRIIIPLDKIKTITWGHNAAIQSKKDKNLLEFIAKDFEDAKPDCLIELNERIEAVLFLGMNRTYSQVAIRLDEPERFRSLLDNKLK